MNTDFLGDTFIIRNSITEVMLGEEQKILDAIEYTPFMYSGVEGVMEVYDHEYVKYCRAEQSWYG